MVDSFPDVEPIFIVGAPRSGTTLLRLLLNAHPEVAIAGEIHFFDQVLQIKKQVPRIDRSDDLDQFFAMLARTNGLRQLREEGQELADRVRRRLEAEPRRSYPMFHRYFMEEYARSQGKERFGEKTPENIRYLERITSIYPKARMIHIVRDPRAVVASLLDVPWTSNDVVINTLKWRVDVEAGHQHMVLNPERTSEVSYEDLVTHPEGTLGEICKFIGVDYDPVMLTYHNTAGEYVKGQPWKYGTLQPVSKESLNKWQKRLNAHQVFIIEKIASNLQHHLAPPPYPHTPVSRLTAPMYFVVELARYAAYKWGEKRRRLTEAAGVIQGENDQLVRRVLRSYGLKSWVR